MSLNEQRKSMNEYDSNIDLTKVGIIIPAYNESKTIGKLIDQLSKLGNWHILVVDDGSIDNTDQIVLDKSVKNQKIHLLRHVVNIGPAFAIHSGVTFGLKLGCIFFVQVDGDGQHPPKEISKLLSTLIDGSYDIVIGSRYLKKTNYETSFTRSFGIWGSSKIISMFCGQKITDVTSGFRAFNVKYAKLIIKYYLSIETLFEYSIKISKEDIKMKEIPMNMTKRNFGKSYLSLPKLFLYPFRISYSVLRAII